MAISDRVLGENLYVSFRGSAIQADFREFTVDLTLDTVDVSAGSEAAKSYLAALQDGTASLTWAYVDLGTADSGYIPQLKIGQEGTLLWGPEGTAAGLPKGGAVALVTSVSKPHTYNDIVTRTAEFQFSGTLLFDDEDDVWP